MNEAKTVGTVVQKGFEAFKRLGISGEVVVADNGSTDGSQAIATSLGARVIPVARRGYGNALRAGMAAAKGRYLIMGDADDTYDFSSIDPFVSELRGGADFVMGTRLPPGRIEPGANPLLNRYLGTPALTFVLNRLFGTQIRDVNCGMRGLTKQAFQTLSLKSEGMEFASEMVIKAALHRVRIAEVPITLYPDRRDRPPHLRRWRDGWRHLEFMLLHAPDQLLFAPGMLAVALGLLLALPVSFGPVFVLGRIFDYHFLFLGGTLILVGLQAVLGAIAIRDIVGGIIMRPTRLATWLARQFSFGRGLLFGMTLAATGLALEAWVLATWLTTNFGPLSEPRKSVLGLVLISAGIQVGLFSFLHAVLKRHRTSAEQGSH